MRQRLIGAAVLVPVVVIVFLLGDPWLTLGIAVLAAMSAYEAARLLKVQPWLAMVVATAAVVGTRITAGTFQIDQWLITFLPAVIIGTAILALRLPADEGVRSWVGTIAAGLYASLMASLVMISTAQGNYLSGPLGTAFEPGRVLLLVLVLTVWSFDTFAYLVGRTLGRGRFFPHLSPNKTLSGAIGGTVAAVVVCAALFGYVGQSVVSGAVLGLVIAIAAQAGDLTESMLKRAAGVKDSGTWIPGHGGILDRVDSFLFAAPAMFLAFAWGSDLLIRHPG